VLTTHTGSLPRPDSLAQALTAHDHGHDAAWDAALTHQVREAVAATVHQQLETGLDVISDGEMGKFGYATYVKERLSGFHGEAAGLSLADLADYPEHAQSVVLDITTPSCTAAVSYTDTRLVLADIDNLRAATKDTGQHDCFLSAASPGVIATFLGNQRYATDEEYLFALAEAMKTEYDLIHEAGFQVQLDCPDLAMGRHTSVPPLESDTFRRQMQLHIEALNHAVRDIPPERLRMHLCWGNYASPHHHDIPLAEIIETVFTARPATVLFEAANPRHEHEWRVFEDVAVPENKILVPGVIDTLTSYIEHPDLVAERIRRYTDLLGPERVMAGADCGFATFANFVNIDPAIAWAKFKSLVHGAERAHQPSTISA
jgi:5-methyltetrahydropteroyltriglutamate--homocysteine methyltransferase